LIYRQIKNILKEEKPDLVFINGIRGLSSAVFSAVTHMGMPHIYFIHDFELISRSSHLFRNGKIIRKFNFFDRIYLSFMRKITSNISAVISPSKYLMNYHLNHGFFKSCNRYVVPNGIPLKEYVAKRGIGKEFIFLGQIVEHKGPQIAVKAFKNLRDADAKLHIVGKGPYLDKLREIAGNDQRIIFYGFVPENELEKFFKKCSYIIVPSLWNEIFGLVIIEGLTKGLPVIASNVGAIPELVTNGFNGFLFEPGDADSLYHIIKELVNDENILSKLSIEAINSSRRFSLETQVENTLDIFHKTASMKK